MSRLLLLVAPRAWRERYGEEVLHELATSNRLWRDRLDLARTVVVLRVDHLARSPAVAGRRSLLVGIGLLLMAVGAALVAVVTPELADRLVELPRHWWSTLAAVPLLPGAALLLLAGRSRRVT